jgi:hypothetical protein
MNIFSYLHTFFPFNPLPMVEGGETTGGKSVEKKFGQDDSADKKEFTSTVNMETRHNLMR